MLQVRNAVRIAEQSFIVSCSAARLPHNVRTRSECSVELRLFGSHLARSRWAVKSTRAVKFSALAQRASASSVSMAATLLAMTSALACFRAAARSSFLETFDP